jgi:hypothetical protein
MTRILRRLPLVVVLLLSALPIATAQEHSFGLRVGSFQFPESSVLTDAVVLDRRPLVVIGYQRDFSSGDFDGTLLEGTYEWRRDTDAHVSMIVSGGIYSETAMETVPGIAQVVDRRGRGSTWFLPTDTVNTLEYAIYYFHFSPRWNFTTGKARFWVGGGLGLWANLWREVNDSTYLDVFSCDRIEDPNPSVPPILVNCTANSQYRESDGNRRTVLPLSASAGFTYQFLPHWSFSLEDRFLFNGQGSTTLFRVDSDFDITGSQDPRRRRLQALIPPVPAVALSERRRSASRSPAEPRGPPGRGRRGAPPGSPPGAGVEAERFRSERRLGSAERVFRGRSRIHPDDPALRHGLARLAASRRPFPARRAGSSSPWPRQRPRRLRAAIWLARGGAAGGERAPEAVAPLREAAVLAPRTDISRRLALALEASGELRGAANAWAAVLRAAARLPEAEARRRRCLQLAADLDHGAARRSPPAG